MIKIENTRLLNSLAAAVVCFTANVALASYDEDTQIQEAIQLSLEQLAIDEELRLRQGGLTDFDLAIQLSLEESPLLQGGLTDFDFAIQLSAEQRRRDEELRLQQDLMEIAEREKQDELALYYALSDAYYSDTVFDVVDQEIIEDANITLVAPLEDLMPEEPNNTIPQVSKIREITHKDFMNFGEVNKIIQARSKEILKEKEKLWFPDELSNDQLDDLVINNYYDEFFNGEFIYNAETFAATKNIQPEDALLIQNKIQEREKILRELNPDIPNVTDRETYINTYAEEFNETREFAELVYNEIMGIRK